MTPEQRAVIEAARAWTDTRGHEGRDPGEVLWDAVAALEASESLERERPWSEVVAEDEIWSTRTEKWYRVLETRITGQLIQRDHGVERQQVNVIGVRIEGVTKPLEVPADVPVLVRRSEMGQAVDVWMGIEVVRSGPS